MGETVKGYETGSGMHPPAVALVGGGLVLAGLGVAVVATPALKLPGVTLAPALHLAKVLVGMWVAATGLGLLGLQPWARPTAQAFLLAGGVLLPLYPWRTGYVDWEFLVTLRAMVVLTSTIVIAYLARPSIRFAFEHGGVPVVSEGFYCAGCNAQHDTAAPPECPHCGGPTFELVRSPSGVAYARNVGPGSSAPAAGGGTPAA